MNKTPRTDAVAKRYDANEIGAAEVLIYAGELERENAALRDALALGQENCNAEYDRLRAERDANKTALVATRNQLAALREALESAENGLRHAVMMEPLDPFKRGKIISEALDVVRAARKEAQP